MTDDEIPPFVIRAVPPLADLSGGEDWEPEGEEDEDEGAEPDGAEDDPGGEDEDG